MTTDAHAAGDLDEPLADGAGHAFFNTIRPKRTSPPRLPQMGGPQDNGKVVFAIGSGRASHGPGHDGREFRNDRTEPRNRPHYLGRRD